MASKAHHGTGEYRVHGGLGKNKEICSVLVTKRGSETNLSIFREDRTPAFRLPVGYRELGGELRHLLGSYVTSVLHNVRIKNVESVLCGDRVTQMVKFELGRRIKKYVKGITSRFVHLDIFSLNFSSLLFAIRVNLLHSWPFLLPFGLFLPCWCFSTLANYFLKVSFQLTTILNIVT